VIKDVNKNLITANKWDNSLGQPGLIKGDNGGKCGENRYMGVVNILEFYLKAGCDLYIEPIDSIYAAVRLNWTLDGFYADGGTTQFSDRLAASLGIHASNIKVVSVYEGSVVVQFLIVDNDKNPLNATSLTDLSGVQAALNTKITKGEISLGAKLIGAEVKGLPVSLVSDPSVSTIPLNTLPTTLPG
jgi:hypothetical protein